MREVRHEENDGSSRHISLVGKPCAVVRKGETVKITIQGADLKTPIQITDRKVLANIQGWSGLGTSSAEAGFNPKAPGFIVDWSQGLTDEPPNYHAMRFRSTLTCPANGSYTLCHMPLTPQRGTVTCTCPAGATRTITSMWVRFFAVEGNVEGNWFHSWTQCDGVAKHLIESHGQ